MNFKQLRIKLFEFTIDDLKDAVSGFTEDKISDRKSKVGSELSAIKLESKKDQNKGILYTFSSKPTGSVAKVYENGLSERSEYTMQVLFDNKEDLQKSDIKLHCNCAGYHYQGMKYHASELDSAIQKESRKDKVWSSIHDGKGAICKHLHGLLNNFESIINKEK